MRSRDGLLYASVAIAAVFVAGLPVPGSAESALPPLEPGTAYQVRTSGVGWAGIEFAVPTDATVEIEAALPSADAYGPADYTFVAFSVYFRDKTSELVGSRSFARLGQNTGDVSGSTMDLEAGQTFHVIVLSTVPGVVAAVRNDYDGEPAKLNADLGPIPAGGVTVMGGPAQAGLAAGAQAATLQGRAASMYGWIDRWERASAGPHAHTTLAPCTVNGQPDEWGSTGAGTASTAGRSRYTKHTLEDIEIKCLAPHASAGIDDIRFAIYAIPLTLQPTR